MALSCLELWPGLGVRWAERARLAGWLCCHAGGGVGYGFSWIRDVSEYSGQRIFCIFVISRAENIEDHQMPKKLYGGTMVEPCHLYPWISIQDFRCMTGPGVSCVYFCVTCVAACLLVGPACKNQFWGGAAGSWKPEALRKLQMCHLSRSLDCLYILWWELNQQHEAISNLAFQKD